jgi:hypothetical protein
MKLQDIKTNEVLQGDKVPALYYLSKKRQLKKLVPTIPKQVLDIEYPFENDTLKRVPFCPSIDACILGLQINEKLFKNGFQYLYVYQPKITKQTKLVNNSIIKRKKLVFDAHITKEWWCLSTIPVKYVGKVKIFNKPKKIEFKPLRVGNKELLKPNGKLDTFGYPHEFEPI